MIEDDAPRDGAGSPPAPEVPGPEPPPDTSSPQAGAAPGGPGDGAGDNHGQQIRAGIIHGGVHYHLDTAEGGASGEATADLMRRARRVDPHRVATIRATFVAPDGYAAFAEGLWPRRVGVITGRPGSGRATAAIHALDAGGMEIREAVPETGDDRWRPEYLPVEPGRAHLLDLTPLGGDRDAHHQRVRAYADRIRERGGRLVVVAETTQWREDPADGYATLPLRPPDPGQVFARYLIHLAGSTEARRWLDRSEIRELLRGESLGYATRLATEIHRARAEPAADPATAFEQRLRSILGIFQTYDQDVQNWFDAHEREAARAEQRRYRGDDAERASREELRRGDYERVLIAAVAVLEGAPSGAVLARVDDLAQRWNVPDPLPSPVSGAGLSRALVRVGARLVAGDNVEFRHTGFGAVVLDHLWREYPKARDPLLDWSHRAARDIPPAHRHVVARRWLDLAERQATAEPVIRLLGAWGATAALRSAVVPVAAAAAVHGELGPEVRRYLYLLATHADAGIQLDETVARVCGRYGTVEPQTALTRLGWLADRASDGAADAVSDALDAIAAEPSCRPILVARLVEWVADPRGRHRATVARAALTELVAGDRDGLPLLLADVLDRAGDMTPRLAGQAVAAALTARSEPPADLLEGWLACLEPGRPEATADVASRILVRAGSEHTAANVRLVRRVAAWARDHPDAPTAALVHRVAAADPLVSVPQSVRS